MLSQTATKLPRYIEAAFQEQARLRDDATAARGQSALSPQMPEPHAKQAALIASPAKRKIVVAGRRAGKTTGFSLLASRGLTKGKRILYATPIADQTDQFWYACKSYFKNDIEAGRLIMSKTKRLLEPPGVDENGPRIRAKTAYDADSLRGDWGDIVILDEYAQMDSDVDTVTAPMMLDTDGVLIRGGTPRGRNHFHLQYMKASADEGGRWYKDHFTSFDNPYLSQPALDEIVKDLTADMYNQEIMAEFLEGEGSVFRNIEACLTAPESATPADHAGHRLVVGGDWGKQKDYTVFSVYCIDCACEVELHRSRAEEYALQGKRLVMLSDKWFHAGVLPERNSMGEPIVEQLIREGLLVLKGPDNKPGFMTTAGTKPQLIERLVLSLEQVASRWLPDIVARAELEAYERKVSRHGNSVYSAPSGMHDDTVIARALALWAAGNTYARFEDFANLGTVEGFKSAWG